MGIHILNYLNDWLILASSEQELIAHKSLLLSHLDRLGLRMFTPLRGSILEKDLVPRNDSAVVCSHMADTAE